MKPNKGFEFVGNPKNPFFSVYLNRFLLNLSKKWPPTLFYDTSKNDISRQQKEKKERKWCILL